MKQLPNGKTFTEGI